MLLASLSEASRSVRAKRQAQKRGYGGEESINKGGTKHPKRRHDSSTERIVSVKDDGGFHSRAGFHGRLLQQLRATEHRARRKECRPPALLPAVAGIGLKALSTYSLVPCMLCRTRLHMANKMALIILDITTRN